MVRFRKLGFTVVELMVVIIIIGLLATIVTVAYRTTQQNARDEKRKVEAIMLRSAVEDYYADHGDFPKVDCSGLPGDIYECWRNEAWQLLKDEGYLKDIPQPNAKSYQEVHNLLPDGNANYAWLYRAPGNVLSYGIYVPMEGESCKTGMNVAPTWWGSAPTCDF